MHACESARVLGWLGTGTVAQSRCWRGHETKCTVQNHPEDCWRARGGCVAAFLSQPVHGPQRLERAQSGAFLARQSWEDGGAWASDPDPGENQRDLLWLVLEGGIHVVWLSVGAVGRA